MAEITDAHWNKLAADYVLNKINNDDGKILIEKISAELCNFIAQFDRYNEQKTFKLSRALHRAILKTIDEETFVEKMLQMIKVKK